MRLLACLIVAPQRGYDEPAILSYAISSFCPTSADGLQSAGGPVGGACNLIVLDAGDVLHDAFAVRGPRIDAEGKVSSHCGHLRPLPLSSSPSRFTAGASEFFILSQ